MDSSRENIDDLHNRLSTFIMPYLRRSAADGRPHTILTWAQSLDAKIAPSSTIRYPLSSWETWYLAHLIRRRSDSILIGAQTAVTDDPSLIGIKIKRLIRANNSEGAIRWNRK